MSKPKTNEEMLKEIYQFIYKECDDKEVPTKFKSYFKKLEQDLYKVNKYEIAINDIVSRKPVMDKYFDPTNGLSISEYVSELVRYVSQLSNIDNIIISAVYEKYQREHEKDLLIANCKCGTKVKVSNGGKDYICEIDDITFEYFRTNYIKELECQFKLYFKEYGTYWKLLNEVE